MLHLKGVIGNQHMGSMAIIIIIKVLKSFVDFLGCLVWFGGMPVGLGLEGLEIQVN